MCVCVCVSVYVCVRACGSPDLGLGVGVGGSVCVCLCLDVSACVCVCVCVMFCPSAWLSSPQEDSVLLPAVRLCEMGRSHRLQAAPLTAGLSKEGLLSKILSNSNAQSLGEKKSENNSPPP